VQAAADHAGLADTNSCQHVVFVDLNPPDPVGFEELHPLDQRGIGGQFSAASWTLIGA